MRPTNGLKLEYEIGTGLSLTGELTLATVTSTYQQSLNYFQSEDSIPKMINLAKVTCVDSAGLSLMIEWLRLGKKQNTEIEFRNIPGQITPLVKLFGIDNLIH